MSQAIPLHEMLAAGREPGYQVGARPELDWRALGALAGAWAQRIGDQGRAYLVAKSDPFEFLAALCACWHRRVTPIVSPDVQPTTLTRLLPSIDGAFIDPPNADGTDAFAALAAIDEGALGSLTVIRGAAASPPANPTASPTWRAFAPDDTAVELFTSGSTGERKRIPKTFAQLANELAELDALWGDRVAGAPLFATVSHLHIYGLLFRLLWPWVTGRPFSDRTYFSWEEMIDHMPAGKAIVVSSPTHLKHLATIAGHFERDWTETSVFSSGGPLATDTAVAIADACASAPIEVFGSTETGGIAWRQQARGAEVPWTPFPSLRCRAPSGQLEIHSPFLPEPTWYLTADKAEMVGESGFHLRGRADRVVKISEKRVSLPEMEALLAAHPWVEEARVIAMPATEAQGRARLGAVAALCPPGRQALVEDGKRPLVGELKNHLRQSFERVMLPRYWRFPETLPRDQQSKISHQRLVALFAPEPHGRNDPDERPKTPTILETEIGETQAIFYCRVPENMYYLEGHFADLPVVAGVVQLQWVCDAIETITGQPPMVKTMQVNKFHRLLLPGAEFRIELERAGEKWTFRILGDNATYASGRWIVR